MLKPTLAALLVLALASPARAEQPPDSRALLEKVVATYRALSTYQMSGTLSTRMAGLGMNVDVPWTTAGDRSGRVRVEYHGPQIGVVTISDGKQVYTFRPALNQYTRQPAPPYDSSASMPPLAASPLMRYWDVLKGLKESRVVGAEAIAVSGRMVDCWVVRCDMTLPPQALAADSTARAVTTFWVDKATRYVRRDSTSLEMTNQQNSQRVTIQQLTSVDELRANEPLADSLFTFVAPPGAQEVQAFTMPGQAAAQPDLVGKKAPLFTLADLQGRKVSLASLRGKVVVLDFWATWCGPCRIEMPRVEKLHRELKSKGVVVLGVNVTEDARLVKRFLAKNPYTFPILLDTQGDAASKYNASAIPTLVVVGKDGTIQTYFQGVRDEEVLRGAVTAAMAAKAPATAGTPAARRRATSSAGAPAPATKKPAPAAPPRP